jgi:hypothetical protein
VDTEVRGKSLASARDRTPVVQPVVGYYRTELPWLQWLTFFQLNPRFSGSNPAKSDGLIRAIKSIA